VIGWGPWVAVVAGLLSDVKVQKKLTWAAMSTISESTRPGTETTSAKHDLPFASVAIAQYHKIQEKLASNNTFRILRSPAPIRVWVYRSLLAENRLWNEWDRPAVSATMDKDKDKESRDDGSIDDTESLRDSEADSVNGARARPHLTRLRLALAPYCVHFNNPGYIRDDTLRMLERDVVKQTLEETRKSLEMREELGLSWEFWDSLAEVLKVAIPSLERRCFAAPDPAAPEYEGLSGPLIASYSPSLLRDLERLNQLVCIARNVQVHGEKVQNLSAERLFDKDIFALINVCVRVTARGYDGEAGTQDEDKWQGVINAYKKLLITCLQFLNNLIARNEQRKLMLWIELFDSHLDNELPNFADMKYKLDEFNQQEPTWQPDTPDPMARPSRSLDTFKIPQQPASSPFLLYIGETGNDVKKALQQHGVKAGANEIAAECRRRWQTMSEEEKNVRVKAPNPKPILTLLTSAEMEHALCRRRGQVSGSTYTVEHIQEGGRPARQERRERAGACKEHQPVAGRGRSDALIHQHFSRKPIARTRFTRCRSQTARKTSAR
jgi:palmitoyltransferase